MISASRSNPLAVPSFAKSGFLFRRLSIKRRPLPYDPGRGDESLRTLEQNPPDMRALSTGGIGIVSLPATDSDGKICDPFL
jgi:hypothetical protein